MQHVLPNEEPLFTNKKLFKLWIPLIFEQFLLIAVGTIDTIMVSSIGDAAISSVHLVDSINILLTQLFAALSTGGAVVTSQYMGRGDRQASCDSARQLFHISFFFGTAIMALSLIFNRGILNLLYGGVEDKVMGYCVTYFALTAISFPFIASYNAGAALFRSMGDSLTPMLISIGVNLINVAGNYIGIYVLGWEVAGAAAATLLSRAVGAVIIAAMLSKKTRPITIAPVFKVRFKKDVIKRILRIGVPSGVENSLFQVGKLMISQIIASFATAAVAADGLANTVGRFGNLAGAAASLAMVTIVGQCMGAGKPEQAEYNAKKLLGFVHIALLITNTLLLVAIDPLLGLFNASAEAKELAKPLLVFYCCVTVFFWPESFTLPHALRAAGDIKFTMWVSLISMFTLRVAMSYVLCYVFNMGLMGVWVSMLLDWFGREIPFIIRFVKGKWKTIKII